MKKLLLFLFCLFAATAVHPQNNARMLTGVNAQTGTSYTFVAADTTRAVTFNNAAPVAVTLPNGATQGFGAGTMLTVINLGAGAVTITCTSCTINGAATLVIAQNQGGDIYGGAGSPAVNYVAAPLGGSGSIGGSIASTQVATGSGPNAIAGDPNFTWLTGSKKLLLGDSVGGLAGSTYQLPPGGSATWALQAIHHTTATTPQDTAVFGATQCDSGVDSVNNHCFGGWFSATALTNLYSGSGNAPLAGVSGVGTTSHSTGNVGQVIGGLFSAFATGAGTAGDVTGIAGQAFVSGSGLVSSLSSSHLYTPSITGGTPPTGVYGQKVDAISGGVNNWGYFIANQAQDSHHWAIQTGTGKNEFGDNTIFDTTASFVEGAAPTGIAGQDVCGSVTATHTYQCSYNNGTAFTVPQEICTGQIALSTGAINSGTRATNTLSCSGLGASTDSISCTFSGDTNAVTGYAPSASGGLTLKTWASTNTINVDQVNDTGGSITPGAATVNCKGIR